MGIEHHFQIHSNQFNSLYIQSLRISSLIVWIGSYFIAIATFQNLAGMSSASPGVLWTFYFIFPLAFVLIYFTSQLFLVFYTLEEKWPISKHIPFLHSHNHNSQSMSYQLASFLSQLNLLPLDSRYNYVNQPNITSTVSFSPQSSTFSPS